MTKPNHLLRLGWAYRISKATVLRFPPYQYTIEPTNVCNLKCAFCPQSDPDHFTIRPRGFLTRDNFALFLARVRAAKPGNRNINLTLDGEPFLNRDFVPFVAGAEQGGFFPIFASNGTLIDHDTADRLIAAGPFRASIDFASEKDVYETIRGRQGDFDIVRENLSYLMERARVSRGVHLDVHDITSYAGKDSGESLAKMRRLFPDRLPGRVRFYTRQFHNFCGHLKTAHDGSDYRLCPYPWIQMAVTYGGDCVPCCRDTAGRSDLGNIFVAPVMAVWNGEPYRQFRQNLLDRRPDRNAACKECDLPYRRDRLRWRLSYMARSLVGR